MTNALAIRPDQEYWTDAQVAAYRAAGITPKSQDEARLFLAYCQKTGLDPFTKQIYLANGAIIVGIDGFRLIAQRTGEYRGQTQPQWCGPDGEWHDIWLADGPPAAARIGVWREGFTAPVWGVVMWREYGSTRGNWSKMPAHMLAKVAESHALRKAFPAQMSGIYTAEEMAQSQRPAAAPVVNTTHLMDALAPGDVDPTTGEVLDADILEPGDE